MAGSLRSDIDVFLFRRCAWHSRIFGWPKILGVKRSLGTSWGWTDGICRQCSAWATARYTRVSDTVSRDIKVARPTAILSTVDDHAVTPDGRDVVEVLD